MKETWQNWSNLEKGLAIGFGIFMFFIIIASIGSSDTGSGGTSSSEEIDRDIELTNCHRRTNEYYKCSWSVREDRCVCEQR